MKQGLLSRLRHDTSGQSMLETVVVLPVLLLLILVIMELCLLFNAKQMADYAAFCAARTASVHGFSSHDDSLRIRTAAAMALGPVSPGLLTDMEDVLKAFGVDEKFKEGLQLGLGGNGSKFEGDELTAFLSRFADAFLRVHRLKMEVLPGPDEKRSVKAINLEFTYYYHCTFLPLGRFFGQPQHQWLEDLKGLAGYGFPIPDGLISRLESISGLLDWNIPLRGHAIMDYWADCLGASDGGGDEQDAGGSEP